MSNLSDSDLDALLLAAATMRWQKVAMVIAKAMSVCDSWDDVSIDLWQVGTAAAAGAVGGGTFANAFKYSSKAVSWWNSARNYKAVSKRVRRVRDVAGDQELHHWFFPNNGWGSSVPNWIKNHPANLHTMDKTMHEALHGIGGNLTPLQKLNYGVPGWFASTLGLAGGDSLGNALKSDCACKN
jgi:hypothetical protein